MKLSKIVKNNKYSGYQLLIKGRKYEALKNTEMLEEEKVLTNYYALMGPKKSLMFITAYAQKKGDYWTDKNGKQYLFRLDRKGLVLGKFSMMLNFY